MKTFWITSLLAAAMAAFVTGCQTGVPMNVAASRVEVVFENPENYSDLKDDLQGTDKGRRDMEQMMRNMVVEEAGNFVKEGQKLTLTFTDVDLAGDFLPSAATAQDIRVIREVYPPRQHFRYTLTDATGAVIKQGEERLSDLSFQTNINPIGRNDELFHDRALFREWARRALR